MTTIQNKALGRTKICEHCKNVISVAFRVRAAQNKNWVFVCEACCKKAAILPEYQYGGTWKGLKKS